MRAYYQHAAVTIYHGDSAELFAELKANVLVTDPPYGLGWTGHRDRNEGDFEIAGDDSTEVRDIILEAWGDRPAVVFGTWKRPRPAGIKALLIWDKGPHVGLGDLRMPWKPNTEEIYILGGGFTGHRGTSVLRHYAISPNFVERDHPTEKPLSLMLELVGKCPPGMVIDPFAGSGTTLVAAKRLGRPAIGIEIDEAHCESAARRLEQDVLPLYDTREPDAAAQETLPGAP